MLQADLMEEDLLGHVLSLLQDSRVEQGVRYFAGGTLAQLVSRPEAWTLGSQLRSTIVEQLVRVDSLDVTVSNSDLALFKVSFSSLQHASIMTWTQLEREMVSYR